MKRNSGIKLIAGISVYAICMGAMMTVSAAANSACQHPVVKQYGSTVGNWTGSHTEIFVEEKGPERCDYTHWVDEVVWMCSDCGEVIAKKTYHHEKHSRCGKNF